MIFISLYSPIRKIVDETESAAFAGAKVSLGRWTSEEMCNGRHPLTQLAKRIDWDRFDREYELLYCDSNGCPARPTRLMAALQYLKYTP